MIDRLAGRLTIVAVLFAACAGFVAQATTTEPTPIRESLVTFPLQLDAWQGASTPAFTDEILKVLGVDEYVSRTYRAGRGQVVGFYLGYYQSQRQGDAIHSPLNCMPGAGWEPVSRTYLPIEVRVSTEAGAPARTIEVNRYLIRKGLDTQVVLYWYQSQGRVVANEYASKVYMVYDAIRSNRTDAAMIRVIAPMASDGEASEAAAERTAVAFVQAMFPHLVRFLPS